MSKKAKMKVSTPPEGRKPMSYLRLSNRALELNCRMRDVCTMCGTRIIVQIFKGSGVCSENCRKDRDNDHAPARALNP